MMGSKAKAAIPQVRKFLADEDDGEAKAAAKALEAIGEVIPVGVSYPQSGRKRTAISGCPFRIERDSG
jgi:hypothetical protein